MSKRRPLKIVSRVHEKRRWKKNAMFPALRISGKWLEEYTAIGEEYRIIRTDKPDELIIQFLKRA